MRLSVADAGLGNGTGGLRAIRIATAPELRALSHAELVDALKRQFLLEADLGEYADALDTYGRLGMTANPPLDAEVESTHKTVEDNIAANLPIAIPATIEDASTPNLILWVKTESAGAWLHTPLRKQFTLKKVPARSTRLFSIAIYPSTRRPTSLTKS